MAKQGFAMDEFSNKQKERAGVAAVLLWLGIGLYVFATSTTASFFSWKTALFFGGGTLAAALVFGLPAFVIQRSVSRLLAPTTDRSDESASSAIKAIGLAVMISQAAAIYLVANWVVNDLLFAA